MKRVFAVILTLLMLGSMTAFASAEGETKVTVTVAVEGSLVAVAESVEVTDADEDGALTISDALSAVHALKNKEYATETTQWGLSITKLWGNTSGNFGYWVNNASAMSLTDAVQNGDAVYAFVYQDGDTFSDQYCYFDASTLSVKDDEEFTLTLMGMVYDYNTWTYSPAPVEGAVITVDGEKTAYKTDAEGKVTMKIETAGSHLISAVGETAVLVPPVCRAQVAATKAQVTVSVADQGDLVCHRQAVTVTDTDGDDALTISDALAAVHALKNKEYATETTQWGLSITKLWGNDSGNFGYWVNHASAWSLTDPVEDGDFVYAFVYQDGDAFSDQYCYFDKTTVSAEEGEAITLTLTGMVYDYNTWTYNPAPVEGAVITVDGEKTTYKTDAEGKVTLKLESAGEHLISAVGEGSVLVPPACVATVTAVQQSGSEQNQPKPPVQEQPPMEDGDTTENPSTGDDTALWLFMGLLAVSGVALAVLIAKKKAYYEE